LSACSDAVAHDRYFPVTREGPQEYLVKRSLGPRNRRYTVPGTEANPASRREGTAGKVAAQRGRETMRKSLLTLIIVGVLASWAAPGLAADNPQQQRMADCNAKAAGMTGDARKTFMSSCLSNKPSEAATSPNCNPAKSKPCGNSCISLDKTCHK
jgi:hypothetical protein